MPKQVNHASYRKQLLAQCFDLFAERGYSALTTRQIAEALNISTGTLYHYFPTKEDLFQQLAEEVTQQTALEAMAQTSEQASFEKRLQKFFGFLAEHEKDFQKQFLIILDYYQHRDLYGYHARTVISAGADRYEQAIQTCLGLPDTSLCKLLHNQITGLLTQRMMQDITTPLVEQARPFLTLFVAAAHHLQGEAKERTGGEDKTEEHIEREEYSYDNSTSTHLHHADQAGSAP